MLVGTKLLLLAVTAALAVHARLRLIPNLSDDNLSGLAWHIRGITALAIAFVVVGALIRQAFQPRIQLHEVLASWLGPLREERSPLGLTHPPGGQTEDHETDL